MKHDKILLSMGAGGRLSAELMKDVFLPAYGNDILKNLDDSAEIDIEGTRLAFTTDSYVIRPIFYPGGNIGELAVCGTVNDLAVKGAYPLVITAGFIIEEGFSTQSLKTIAQSMHDAADRAGVQIVAGDTKVVGRGEADGVFINTSGIGVIIRGMNISSSHAKPGDDIIVSGTMGDHGVAILNAREGLDFQPRIESDTAPVFDIVERISEFAENIHVMRDPTRGGLASVVNEIASASRVNISLFEDKIPVREDVRKCCDLLGIDSLYVANEGKVVIFCSPESTPQIMNKIKESPIGQNASVIGRVEDSNYSENTPPVSLITAMGTKRFVPLIEGEPLPRIC